MKKKIFTIIFVIVTIIIGLIIFSKFINFSNNDENIYDIKERKYNVIGDNLYYTDKLITQKSKTGDSEVILNYYESISSYMKQKYPGVKVFISNFNYDTLNKEKNAMFFNGYQIINNVIIENIFFTIYLEDSIVNENHLPNLNSFINRKFDREKLISMDLIKEKVSNIINQKIKSMGNFIIEDEWEYYLSYSNGSLCYKFNLSNGSYIKIGAETGEVIDDYFFNGIIY